MRQPNQWSCVPFAFALCLDIDFEEFIELIGHDGSRIIKPELEDPERRQGFHVQECVVACLDLGIRPIYIQPDPVLQVNENETISLDFDLQKYIDHYNGVLLVQAKDKNYGHAVAWKNKQIIDPNGTTYSYEELLNKFEIVMFILL